MTISKSTCFDYTFTIELHNLGLEIINEIVFAFLELGVDFPHYQIAPINIDPIPIGGKRSVEFPDGFKVTNCYLLYKTSNKFFLTTNIISCGDDNYFDSIRVEWIGRLIDDQYEVATVQISGFPHEQG